MPLRRAAPLSFVLPHTLGISALLGCVLIASCTGRTGSGAPDVGDPQPAGGEVPGEGSGTPSPGETGASPTGGAPSGEGSSAGESGGNATSAGGASGGGTSGGTSAPLPPPESETDVVIDFGARWSYFDRGVSPSPTWVAPTFDASAWPRGQAPLGYGDAGIRTEVSFGPSALNKYIVTYFQRTFDVPADATVTAAALDLVRDDGAAVYINGMEVLRSNLPSGPLDNDTRASTVVGGSAEAAAGRYDLPVASIVRGRNVIAVSVHQSDGRSSDLRLDVRLTLTWDRPAVGTTGGSSGGGTSGGDTTGGTTGGGRVAYLVGAGDIADCGSGGDEQTALLLDRIPGTVFLAGDTVYENGTTDEFNRCFDPTWGRFKPRLRPAPGNHEYNTPAARPYYAYFGASAGDPRKGFYSYDLGAWHIVVLNSNCNDVGCGAGSEQERWLREDLAQNPTACTLAYWHHPRYSSGFHGDSASMRGLYSILYRSGVDVALTGHDHHYERFEPMDDAGNVDPARGIVNFVVGTGGRSLRPPLLPRRGSVVRDWRTWGVLRMTLLEQGYEFEFVPVEGRTFGDSGSGRCH